MTSVLYDLPGPRAISRNRIIGIFTVVILAGLVGFVVYKFAATGQFSGDKWVMFTYTTTWTRVGDAILATLSAFALASVLSLALGFVLAMGRLSDRVLVRVPCTVFVELFRAIPLLVLIMIFYYGIPMFGITVSPYIGLVAGLTLYNGSVLSEVFRAGVNSLPRGQAEAGYALGLRKSGVMNMILVPQAVRAMLPVIIAQLVVVLKDTALGFLITYQELLYAARFLGQRPEFDFAILPSSIVISIIYIGMCLILSAVAVYVERRMRTAKKIRKSKPA